MGMGLISFVNILSYSYVLALIMGVYIFIAFKLYVRYKDTLRETLDSFKGKSYIDNDVFIHSNIYGKSYLETYVEEDPPRSYDVINVEYMTGEFIIMLEKEKKINYFTNSGFSRWAQDLPINNNLVYPIPLGKITSKNFPDKPPHLFTDDWRKNKHKITYELR